MWIEINAIGEYTKTILATLVQRKLADEIMDKTCGGARDDQDAILRALIGLELLGYNLVKKG